MNGTNGINNMAMMPNVEIRNGIARITITDEDIINIMSKGFGDSYKNMITVKRTETGYSVFITVQPLIDKINNEFRVSTGENVELVSTTNPNVELKINRDAIKLTLSKMFKNAKILDEGDKFVIEIAVPQGQPPAGMMSGLMGNPFSQGNNNPFR